MEVRKFHFSNREKRSPIKIHYKDLEPYQKKRLWVSLGLIISIFTLYLIVTCTFLNQNRARQTTTWEKHLSTDPALMAEVEKRATASGATQVSVGTFVGNIPSLSIKDSSFKMYLWIWFRWSGDDALDPMNHFRIYKGSYDKLDVVKDEVIGGEHYQLVRTTVTVNRTFDTTRFPLSSHQMYTYLESSYPVTRMVYVADTSKGGESTISDNIDISGYNVMDHDTAVTAYQYESDHGDPSKDGDIINSEFLTAVMVNRASFGTYIRCFIALVGTITWVLITLFICTYHRVDPLAMIPAALFGTVTNIMVGANLLPEAIDTGLLEFVNFFGIAILLAGAIAIININRVRNKYETYEFAGYYGRAMLIALTAFTILGNLLLPFFAYIWW